MRKYHDKNLGKNVVAVLKKPGETFTLEEFQRGIGMEAEKE